MDVDSYLGCVALNLDARHACQLQAVFQELTQIVVLYQDIAKSVVLSKPAGIPIFDDTDTKSVWINLLTHSLPPPLAIPFL